MINEGEGSIWIEKPITARATTLILRHENNLFAVHLVARATTSYTVNNVTLTSIGGKQLKTECVNSNSELMWKRKNLSMHEIYTIIPFTGFLE